MTSTFKMIKIAGVFTAVAFACGMANAEIIRITNTHTATVAGTQVTTPYYGWYDTETTMVYADQIVNGVHTINKNIPMGTTSLLAPTYGTNTISLNGYSITANGGPDFTLTTLTTFVKAALNNGTVTVPSVSSDPTLKVSTYEIYTIVNGQLIKGIGYDNSKLTGSELTLSTTITTPGQVNYGTDTTLSAAGLTTTGDVVSGNGSSLNAVGADVAKLKKDVATIKEDMEESTAITSLRIDTSGNLLASTKDVTDSIIGKVGGTGNANASTVSYADGVLTIDGVAYTLPNGSNLISAINNKQVISGIFDPATGSFSTTTNTFGANTGALATAQYATGLVDSEAAIRAANDKLLQDNIDAEATTRRLADEGLTRDINNEVNARTRAFEKLDKEFTNSVTVYDHNGQPMTLDSSDRLHTQTFYSAVNMSTMIASGMVAEEANTRRMADGTRSFNVLGGTVTDITTAVNAETNARKAADAAIWTNTGSNNNVNKNIRGENLAGSINNLDSKVDREVNRLDGRITEVDNKHTAWNERQDAHLARHDQQINVLEVKTQNQSAVAGKTTFKGEVVADVVTTGVLNAKTANIKTANIDTANVKTANIETANVKTANIEQANIKIANIDLATVNTAVIQKAEIVEANIDRSTTRVATIGDLTVTGDARVRGSLFVNGRSEDVGSTLNKHEGAIKSIAAITVNTFLNDSLPQEAKDAGVSLSATSSSMSVNKQLGDGYVGSVSTNGVSVSKSHDVTENFRVQGSIGTEGVNVGAFAHVDGNGVGVSKFGASIMVQNHVIPLTPQGFVVAAVSGAINSVTGKTQKEIASLKAQNAQMASELADLKAQVAAILAAQQSK